MPDTMSSDLTARTTNPPAGHHTGSTTPATTGHHPTTGNDRQWERSGTQCWPALACPGETQRLAPPIPAYRPSGSASPAEGDNAIHAPGASLHSPDTYRLRL